MSQARNLLQVVHLNVGYLNKRTVIFSAQFCYCIIKILPWIMNSQCSKESVIWVVMLFNLLKVNHRRCELTTYFILVSWLAYSFTVEVEATYSWKMSVDFQFTMQHCIPQDRTLHKHCCMNFKSYKIIAVHTLFRLQ